MKLLKLLAICIGISSATVSYAQIWQKKDIETLAKELVSAQMKAERKLYKSLDDAIDCTKVPTMPRKKCDDINFIMKKHSGSTIRMRDSNGNEVNLPKNAPQQMISFILNPSIENALAVRDMNETIKKDANQKSMISNLANNLQKQVSSNSSFNPEFKRQINENSVRLTFIVNPNEQSSIVSLQTAKSIQELYADISIGVYYTTGTPDQLQSLNQTFGFNGSIMSLKQLNAAKARYYPLIWVDNKNLRFRRAFEGLPSEPELLDQIEIVSNIELVKDHFEFGDAK